MTRLPAIFTWPPDYTQVGTYKATFQVSDGECLDLETIIITVNPINHPPMLASIGNKSVDEGNLLTFEVIASDSDTDDIISYTAENLPGGLLLILQLFLSPLPGPRIIPRPGPIRLRS